MQAHILKMHDLTSWAFALLAVIAALLYVRAARTQRAFPTASQSPVIQVTSTLALNKALDKGYEEVRAQNFDSGWADEWLVH